MSVIPEVLGRELSSLMAIPTTPLPRPDAVAVESLLKGPHEEVVYFIANGGRVKIGYTTNLFGRLRALSLRKDNVLTALAGSPELEQTLHAHFAEHRRGNTEWFDLAPEIVRYISGATLSPRPARAETPSPSEPPSRAHKVPDLLIRVIEAASDQPRLSTTGVISALSLDMSPKSLGTQFARWGAPAGKQRINGVDVRGPLVKDLESAVARIEGGGPAEVSSGSPN
jgi:hypothetical protein